MRAALHLHSTYSDGEFTIAELRELFLRIGCRVIAVTDHADALDDDARSRYADECARYSDDCLFILPGLEFECERRMHIVGYGVTTGCGSEEPSVVIRHIAACGGVSVIAHPRAEHFDWIRSFDPLPNGIEAWNSKYDGRRAPRPETFDLIRSLHVRDPGLKAFYGIDLHWRRQYRGLLVSLDAAPSPVDRTAVLEALRGGAFHGMAEDFVLASTGELPSGLRARFGTMHRRHMRLRRVVRQAGRWAESLGLHAPEGLKSRLRGLF